MTEELDLLIENFLNTLDDYEKLQKELGDDFANAFINLATANQSTSLNVKYGKEMYDNRITATSVIDINKEDSSLRLNTITEFKRGESPTNPISMFGILVPSSLRQAQGHFRTGLSNSIKLINIVKQLDELEEKIKTKQIEIEHIESHHASKSIESDSKQSSTITATSL